jgi:aminoglycoside/choline kinase family phosphotransferase
MQQDVVEWYLESRMNDYNTEEELRYYEKLIHTIIGNLIKQEKILIIVKDDPNYTRRLLMLHANCYTD